MKMGKAGFLATMFLVTSVGSVAQAAPLCTTNAQCTPRAPQCLGPLPILKTCGCDSNAACGAAGYARCDSVAHMCLATGETGPGDLTPEQRLAITLDPHVCVTALGLDVCVALGLAVGGDAGISVDPPVITVGTNDGGLGIDIGLDASVGDAGTTIEIEIPGTSSSSSSGAPATSSSSSSSGSHPASSSGSAAATSSGAAPSSSSGGHAAATSSGDAGAPAASEDGDDWSTDPTSASGGGGCSTAGDPHGGALGFLAGAFALALGVVRLKRRK